MHRPKRVNVIVSNTNDPCHNLALEEYFMNAVNTDEWILFWWQSENAVVIGRNQNPYQECHLEKMLADDVTLVRRLSGGGAVYHDLGNLNFAFIAKGDLFNPKVHFEVLLDGLSKMGINGEFTGRNDLTVLGRKFSGNAFIHEEDNYLHHGTLLIDSNVSKIGNYLNVSHRKLDTKGFDSVKSRVINLCQLVPEISKEMIISHVSDAVVTGLNCEVNHLDFESLSREESRIYLDKYKSPVWNYGDTPDFSFKVEDHFGWGTLKIALKIENGIIENASITTDALEAEAFSKLSKNLRGIPLLPDDLYQIISESGLKKHMVMDVYVLINEAVFR